MVGLELFLSSKKSLFKQLRIKIDSFFKENIRSPFSWSNILWDPYVEDDIPEKSLRFAKIITALLALSKLVNAIILGVCLAVDGLYSFYRDRFELKITKSWEQDVPKIARMMLGILITLNFVNLI
ncbi:MAG: hypothetical protein QXO84_01685 [Candidatus Aenigmatarchaeota archaeon]